ncbi:hypothetical protein IAG25_39830 [Caballeronia sp. EK]|uniref:hypothetical protein n=1 Tax=Caballeronia sp. EK TaxID=2767469 RepID=UPI001655F503|nr:hypothetical protein [Caballeronia sp. EK]MBC8642927.1 hypothetical protein [Caballeronia sp. EK]
MEWRVAKPLGVVTYEHSHYFARIASEDIRQQRSEKGRIAERKATIERSEELSVSHQVLLVGIAGSSAFCRRQSFSETNKVLMRQIEEFHPEDLLSGAVMQVRQLRHEVGPCRVRALLEPVGRNGQLGMVSPPINAVSSQRARSPRRS